MCRERQDLIDTEIRYADMADFPAGDKTIKRLGKVWHRGQEIGAVDLVEIDVIDFQAGK